jgi:hypothetical protein
MRMTIDKEMLNKVLSGKTDYSLTNKHLEDLNAK